jgi:hypothetical protein
MLERAQVLAWLGRTGPALEGYRAFRAAYPERAREADLRIAQAQAWGGDAAAALATLAPWVERGERQAVLDDATYRGWRGELGEARARVARWLEGHAEDAEAALLAARLELWAGRPGAARARLRPLLDGPTGRDAQLLLDDVVAEEGAWVGPRDVVTVTSEKLVTQVATVVGRLPAGQGHAEVEAGWSEVSLPGARRGSAVAGLGLAHPVGALGGLDGGFGWREDFGGRPGYTARGGATARLLPGLALRLDAARVLLDATPAAVDLRGTMQTYDGSLAWTFGGGRSSLGAGAGLALLSAGSRRRSLAASGEQRFPWSQWVFRLGFLGRAFGYSETLPLGFFNPERYRYLGLTTGATWRRGRTLEAEASLKGGWQRVDQDRARFTWGGGLTLVAAGESWPVQLLAGWSLTVAGLPVTVPQDPAAYR